MKFMFVFFLFTLSPDTSIQSIDYILKKEYSTLEECNQAGRDMVELLSAETVPNIRSVSTCIELP